MAILKRYELARVNTATTGNGSPITLAGAVPGYLSFAAAGVANGDLVPYCIRDGNASEVGTGVYTSVGTTLTRTVIKSTNADARIILSGNAEVFIGPRAADFGAGANQALLLDDTGAFPTSLISAYIQTLLNDADAATARATLVITPSNNLVINGGMEISQFNGTTAVAAINGYLLDCWLVTKSGAHVLTGQQVADAPAGFKNSLKVTVTTANASPGTGDYAEIYTPIEGYRTARLGFGAAGASSISIGFSVKANRTGNYSASILNGATNRSYRFTFTVNAAGTWEYKTKTVPGDTAGTWDVTNGQGLVLIISMLEGTARSGAADSWLGTLTPGVTGNVNGVAATSDYMNLTAVSIIPGSVAVPQELSSDVVPSYPEMLALSQRYFQRSEFGFSGLGIGSAFSTTQIWGQCLPLPVTMRNTPTVTISAIGHLTCYYGSGPLSVVATAGSFSGGPNAIRVNTITVGTAVFTVGQAVTLVWNTAAGYFDMDARL
jgi:hypothetical protein